jgi:hypothetical protein
LQSDARVGSLFGFENPWVRLGAEFPTDIWGPGLSFFSIGEYPKKKRIARKTAPKNIRDTIHFESIVYQDSILNSGLE